MRTSFFLVLAAALLSLPGCYRPDLKMLYVRPSKVEPPPYEGVRYAFSVENVDYPAELFIRPASADGPVVVQGYLSSDGVARDGGPAGGLQIVPTGSALAKGATLSGSFQATADLDRSRPFLILTVVPSRAQTDRDLGNNSLAAVIDPTPPSDLGQWLFEHPWIKRNLKWEQPGGSVVDYDHWDAALKLALQNHVNGILSGTPVAVADPPPLATTPTGTEHAATTLALDTAQAIFLAQAARSIVSDEQLPWKASELDDAELTMLFDSRQLFRWDAARGAYFRDSLVYGTATPGDPSIVYAYMQSNALIGATRVDTLHRVLDWGRGLTHFIGGHSAANYVNHWQYAGDPPASRILAGTVRADDPLAATRKYTAGCGGTSGLLSLILRTVNIPADHTRHEGHSYPRFMQEGLHLSHGDDPYNVHLKTGPWIPIAELPISNAQYDAWFGPSTTSAERYTNIGRRVCELTAQYLSGELVRQHCVDIAGGASHATSQVYATLQRCRTLAELESMELWARLDAKAVELRYCIP